MSAIGLLTVTLLSGALAAVMSVIAWRVSREERARADARTSALAAEIHAERLETRVGVPAAASACHPTFGIRAQLPPRRQAAVRTPASRLRAVMIDDLPLRDAHVPSVAAPEPPRLAVTAGSSGLRFATVGAIGIFVVGALAALAVLLSPGPRTAPPGPFPATASGDIVADAQPLELMALGHERDGDRLIVRGVVRNLSSGAGVDRLAAVVFVFNRDGKFVMSARAAVQAGALDPDHESTFVVAIPNAGDVSRYRVSFHAADERVVPHIDKRRLNAVARAQ